MRSKGTETGFAGKTHLTFPYEEDVAIDLHPPKSLLNYEYPKKAYSKPESEQTLMEFFKNVRPVPRPATPMASGTLLKRPATVKSQTKFFKTEKELGDDIVAFDAYMQPTIDELRATGIVPYERITADESTKLKMRSTPFMEAVLRAYEELHDKAVGAVNLIGLMKTNVIDVARATLLSIEQNRSKSIFLSNDITKGTRALLTQKRDDYDKSMKWIRRLEGGVKVASDDLMTSIKIAIANHDRRRTHLVTTVNDMRRNLEDLNVALSEGKITQKAAVRRAIDRLDDLLNAPDLIRTYDHYKDDKNRLWSVGTDDNAMVRFVTEPVRSFSGFPEALDDKSFVAVEALSQKYSTFLSALTELNHIDRFERMHASDNESLNAAAFNVDLTNTTDRFLSMLKPLDDALVKTGDDVNAHNQVRKTLLIEYIEGKPSFGVFKGIALGSDIKIIDAKSYELTFLNLHLGYAFLIDQLSASTSINEHLGRITAKASELRDRCASIAPPPEGCPNVTEYQIKDAYIELIFTLTTKAGAITKQTMFDLPISQNVARSFEDNDYDALIRAWLRDTYDIPFITFEEKLVPLEDASGQDDSIKRLYVDLSADVVASRKNVERYANRLESDENKATFSDDESYKSLVVRGHVLVDAFDVLYKSAGIANTKTMDTFKSFKARYVELENNVSTFVRDFGQFFSVDRSSNKPHSDDNDALSKLVASNDEAQSARKTEEQKMNDISREQEEKKREQNAIEEKRRLAEKLELEMTEKRRLDEEKQPKEQSQTSNDEKPVLTSTMEDYRIEKDRYVKKRLNDMFGSVINEQVKIIRREFAPKTTSFSKHEESSDSEQNYDYDIVVDALSTLRRQLETLIDLFDTRPILNVMESEIFVKRMQQNASREEREQRIRDVKPFYVGKNDAVKDYAIRGFLSRLSDALQPIYVSLDDFNDQETQDPNLVRTFFENVKEAFKLASNDEDPSQLESMLSGLNEVLYLGFFGSNPSELTLWDGSIEVFNTSVKRLDALMPNFLVLLTYYKLDSTRDETGAIDPNFRFLRELFSIVTKPINNYVSAYDRSLRKMIERFDAFSTYSKREDLPVPAERTPAYAYVKYRNVLDPIVRAINYGENDDAKASDKEESRRKNNVRAFFDDVENVAYELKDFKEEKPTLKDMLRSYSNEGLLDRLGYESIGNLAGNVFSLMEGVRKIDTLKNLIIELTNNEYMIVDCFVTTMDLAFFLNDWNLIRQTEYDYFYACATIYERVMDIELVDRNIAVDDDDFVREKGAIEEFIRGMSLIRTLYCFSVQDKFGRIKNREDTTWGEFNETLDRLLNELAERIDGFKADASQPTKVVKRLPLFTERSASRARALDPEGSLKDALAEEYLPVIIGSRSLGPLTRRLNDRKTYLVANPVESIREAIFELFEVLNVKTHPDTIVKDKPSKMWDYTLRELMRKSIGEIATTMNVDRESLKIELDNANRGLDLVLLPNMRDNLQFTYDRQELNDLATYGVILLSSYDINIDADVVSLFFKQNTPPLSLSLPSPPGFNERESSEGETPIVKQEPEPDVSAEFDITW